MKKLIIGFVVGVFVCVSFFEFIHKTVEIDGTPLCAVIYDRLQQRYSGGFTTGLRITYKVFAWPVKTIWVYVNEDEIAVLRKGKGWEIKELKCPIYQY